MRQKFGIALVFTTLLIGVVVYAQTTSNAALSLTVIPVRQQVLRLEPIGLRFSLENRSNTNLVLAGSISLHSIKLSIRKPNGATLQPQQLSYEPGSRIAFNREKTIPPGDGVAWNEILEFNLNEYFDQPGDYQLKATYQNGDSLLSTDWVNLVVEQPSGDDLAAFEFLQKFNDTNASVFSYGRQENRFAFVQRFPNSRYSDYVRYSIAQALVGIDDKKANEYFQTLEGKDNFLYSSEVKNQLKRLRNKE